MIKPEVSQSKDVAVVIVCPRSHVISSAVAVARACHLYNAKSTGSKVSLTRSNVACMDTSALPHDVLCSPKFSNLAPSCHIIPPPPSPTHPPGGELHDAMIEILLKESTTARIVPEKICSQLPHPPLCSPPPPKTQEDYTVSVLFLLLDVDGIVGGDGLQPNEAANLDILCAGVRNAAKLTDMPTNELDTDAFVAEAKSVADSLGPKVKMEVISGRKTSPARLHVISDREI